MTIVKLGQMYQINKDLEKDLPIMLKLFRDKFGGDPEIIEISNYAKSDIKDIEGIHVVKKRETPQGHTFFIMSEIMRRQRYSGV